MIRFGIGSEFWIRFESLTRQQFEVYYGPTESTAELVARHSDVGVLVKECAPLPVTILPASTT